MDREGKYQPAGSLGTADLPGGGRLRVLVVATEMPPVRSGLATVVDQIVTGLRSLAYDVDHLTAADLGRITLGEVRLTGLALHWPELKQRLQHYDLINLHGPAPTFSDLFLLLWRALPRRARPALVYTYHSDIELAALRPLCWAYNRAHRWLLRDADHVVVSTESYRQIATMSGLRRVRIVPHAVQNGHHDPTRVAPRGPRFTVAFVGQLRPYKGVDLLLRAAAALPDVRFEVVGTGHIEPTLHALAQRLRLDNVVWHGFLSDQERDQVLRRAHIIALPSRTHSEAFGIALLEGMLEGAVPVGSDLPGVRDVVAPSGVLCRPGDPRSLVHAICYLRDDPEEWRRRSQKSVEVALLNQWDRSIVGYSRLFQEVAFNRAQAVTSSSTC